MNIIVEIAQESDEWDNVPYVDESLFSEIASIVLARYPNFSKVKELELSILLTGAKQMQYLNNEFRNKDKATNVLVCFCHPDVKSSSKSNSNSHRNPRYLNSAIP